MHLCVDCGKPFNSTLSFNCSNIFYKLITKKIDCLDLGQKSIYNSGLQKLRFWHKRETCLSFTPTCQL